MKLLRVMVLLLGSSLIAACPTEEKSFERETIKVAKQKVKEVFKYNKDYLFLKVEGAKFYPRNMTGEEDYIRDRVCGTALVRGIESKEEVRFLYYAYMGWVSCGFYKTCPSASVTIIPASEDVVLNISQEELASNRRGLEFLCREIPNGVKKPRDLFYQPPYESPDSSDPANF